MIEFDPAQASVDLTRTQERLRRATARTARSLRGMQWTLAALFVASAFSAGFYARIGNWPSVASAVMTALVAVAVSRMLVVVRRLVASAGAMSEVADGWRLLYEDAAGIKPLP